MLSTTVFSHSTESPQQSKARWRSRRDVTCHNHCKKIVCCGSGSWCSSLRTRPRQSLVRPRTRWRLQRGEGSSSASRTRGGTSKGGAGRHSRHQDHQGKGARASWRGGLIGGANNPFSAKAFQSEDAGSDLLGWHSHRISCRW